MAGEKDLKSETAAVKKMVEAMEFEADELDMDALLPQNDYSEGVVAKAMEAIRSNVDKEIAAYPDDKAHKDKRTILLDYSTKLATLDLVLRTNVNLLIHNQYPDWDQVKDKINEAKKALDKASNMALNPVTDRDLIKFINDEKQKLKDLEDKKLLEEMEFIKKSLINQKTTNFPKKYAEKRMLDPRYVARGVTDVDETKLRAGGTTASASNIADVLKMLDKSKATVFKVSGKTPESDVLIQVKRDASGKPVSFRPAYVPLPERPMRFPKVREGLRNSKIGKKLLKLVSETKDTDAPLGKGMWEKYDNTWKKTFETCALKTKEETIYLTADPGHADARDMSRKLFILEKMKLKGEVAPEVLQALMNSYGSASKAEKREIDALLLQIQKMNQAIAQAEIDRVLDTPGLSGPEIESKIIENKLNHHIAELTKFRGVDAAGDPLPPPPPPADLKDVVGGDLKTPQEVTLALNKEAKEIVERLKIVEEAGVTIASLREQGKPVADAKKLIDEAKTELGYLMERAAKCADEKEYKVLPPLPTAADTKAQADKFAELRDKAASLDTEMTKLETAPVYRRGV
jgi:hypothetical protein